MADNNSTIIAHELTKKFGDFTAVSGISFNVQRGEIFGFLGPNGSGKTTTIRMMLGLLKPTHGQVRVLGMDIDGGTTYIRQKVGYMSQRFSLYNDLTVMENLQFYAKAYNSANSELSERIQEALRLSGLEGNEGTITNDLSGGWRQRLALSAAIIHQPEVLFLDEPTAGVDPVSRRAFWNLLYELAAQGVTVFVTTHYMDEAEHCHKLAFIQRGKIIAHGSPTQIKQNLIQCQVLEFAPSDPNKAIEVLRKALQEERLPIQDVELYGLLVHVIVPDVRRHQHAILTELRRAQIQPDHISIIEPSLEDVFIACMR